jgi:nicastrin
MTGRLLHWSAVVSNGAIGSSTQSSVPPYVAVLDEADYTNHTISMLQTFSSNFVAGDDYGPVTDGGKPLRGVLVLSTDPSSVDGITFPSPEPLTPQGDGTPMESLTVGSSYEWNVNNNGDGLLFADLIGVPTVYVADSQTAAYLRKVALEQANLISSELTAAVYPSVLSEFNYYMGPSTTTDGTKVTSKQCLEWKDLDGTWSPKCLPLGGNSVWAAAGTPVTLGYNNDKNDENANNSQDRPTVILSASIDSTSMFHDLSPGSNTAASNILSLLLAAELLGSSIKDEVLDQLYARITFAFFQGESHGFIGSRLFVKDVTGSFECQAGNKGIPSVWKRKDETSTVRSCLNPLRSDLTFQNLGDIRGMIAVDQVGNLGGGKTLYVQGGNENGFDAFMSEVMIELSANGEYTVQASSASNNNEDGATSLPPSPVSSLVKLSPSSASGVVLTGYDAAFVANSLYHSHLDSVSKRQSIDKDAIAASATLLARSAVAAAYQNENNEADAATAAAYALELLPNAVSSSSATFENLFDCLFNDGNCKTFVKYASVESANDAIRTGVNLGIGQPLGKPPNFYVSVYNAENGQGFAAASGFKYGAMDPSAEDKDDNVKNYGESENDAILLRPSLLEMSLNGLLNNFLGRGSFTDGSASDLVDCASSNDCSSVSYCSSSDLAAICAGGKCVCGSRAHYHPALDEAMSPAANRAPGWFAIDGNDQGVSAMITEPFWSSYVGVRIFDDAGKGPGIYASISGALFASICLVVVYRLKKGLMKEKVY